jgi:hypothetical protein
MVLIPGVAHAEESHSSHRTFSGVVIKQGTGITVKTPEGAEFQVNENQSHRHGHVACKEGDEVSVVVDETTQPLTFITMAKKENIPSSPAS